MQIKGSRLILYDKSGVFLGLGNQELYLLGYEDMEEFKNYHNDFADLFVNKPGYIFKFQNFSWIDYTLHSGTPNRKVLIKTKSGKEIETSITINEIFLNKEINSANTCFCIELSNAPFKKELQNIPKSDTIPQIESASFAPQIEIISQDTPFVQTVDFGEEPTLYNTDYAPSLAPEENTKSDFDMVVNDVPAPEAVMGIKLKFDDAILKPEPQTYSSIDEIKIDDLDFTVSQERYPDDEQEDLLNDTNLLVNDIHLKREATSSDTDFDLCAIADELGLDISLLAQILSEYIEEIDTKMPIIKTAINQKDFVVAKDEISKLKSVAHHLLVLQLYNQFESLEKILHDEDTEASNDALLHLTQTIQAFKDIVQ